MALRELAQFSKMIALNEITPEIMKDEGVQNQFVIVVDAMSKSILGQQLLPQIYAEYIEIILVMNMLVLLTSMIQNLHLICGLVNLKII